MVERRLQKYQLLEEVGQGGMAVVYRGIDTTLNREVAVKILHPHLAKEEESKQRFQREAQAVAKLRHENILEIFDYSGASSEESYIVTEFIHGVTLRDFLAQNPISHPEIAAMIICEVCRALAHAHDFSVIHRDIKPENIMIRRDGRVKLTDFGIAQMVDLHKLTVTGQLLGSPAYMSPELVQGGFLDYRSDVFSVGTLLYQLATSEMPFKGKNPHETLKRIADGRYIAPELTNPTVDSELGRIIGRALAHRPDDRYERIADLRSDLQSFLAKVGIDDPRAELGRYFADPPGYARELQKRLVEALRARGQRELDAGRKAKALRYFDRLLCLDPANVEVLAILRDLSRQRRWARLAALGSGALIATAGLFALAAYWPGGQSSAGPPRDSSLGSAPDPRPNAVTLAVDRGRPRRGQIDAGTPDGGTHDAPSIAANRDQGVPRDLEQAPPGRAKARTLRQRTRRARRRPSQRGTRRGVHSRPARDMALEPKAERRVEIIPRPKAVTIWMNGRRLGDYGPDLRFIELPDGPITLTVRNDACCFQRVVTIGAEQDPERLPVRLRWKPGRVRVNVRPAVNADVVVGSLVARVGQTVEVPIPDYSSMGRTGVQVTVSASGYATESRTVSVRANNLTTLAISLRRLP